MSNIASGDAWRWSRASGNDLMVMLALCDYANDDFNFEAWPSLEKLAVKARVSRSTAYRCIQRLEEMGEIVCVYVGKLDGKPNRYRVTPGGREVRQIDVPPAKEEGQIPTHPVGRSSDPQTLSEPLSLEVEEDGRDKTLAEVMEVLDSAAKARGCKKADAQGVLELIGEFPDRDHVRVAKDLRFWLLHGKGTSRQRIRMTATYRTFLGKAGPRSTNGQGTASFKAPDGTAETSWERILRLEREGSA